MDEDFIFISDTENKPESPINNYQQKKPLTIEEIDLSEEFIIDS